MTDALPRRAAAFLRRAGLLAGLLAVLAGIIGMHIMTGPHGMPASNAVQGEEMPKVMQPPAEYSAHAASVEGSSPSPNTRSVPEPSCADLGGCASMSPMDASCIPSPGNASLAAPLPGNTPFAAHDDADAPTPAFRYSYRPGSPSPGQLCISRT